MIEHKWPRFEKAFRGFDPKKAACLANDDLAKLRRDERIVRNPQKIQATRDNARFLVALAEEHAAPRVGDVARGEPVTHERPKGGI
ncbi:MAG: DNA-3-methyladenine glycosylase I [Myxococcota bacterium]